MSDKSHKQVIQPQTKGVPGAGIKWDIIPERTVMLVIDMQNMFLHPEGYNVVLAAKEIVPNINRLADTCRKAGIPVIWLQYCLRKDGSDLGLIANFEPAVLSGEMAAVDGTKGIEIYGELKVEPQDLRVKKNRYSAFTLGSSNLEQILRGLKRDTIIVTGTATDMCCGLTIAGGMELDFKVIAVADGMATFTEELHNWFLSKIGSFWGQVVSTNELVKEIDTHIK